MVGDGGPWLWTGPKLGAVSVTNTASGGHGVADAFAAEEPGEYEGAGIGLIDGGAGGAAGGSPGLAGLEQDPVGEGAGVEVGGNLAGGYGFNAPARPTSPLSTSTAAKRVTPD